MDCLIGVIGGEMFSMLGVVFGVGGFEIPLWKFVYERKQASRGRCRNVVAQTVGWLDGTKAVRPHDHLKISQTSKVVLRREIKSVFPSSPIYAILKSIS